MMVAAFNYLNRGMMVESQRWSQRLLEFGRSRRDPRSTAIALWTMAWQSMLSGDFDAALHHGQEAIGVAITQFDQVMSHAAIGTAQIATGRVAEGIATVEKARRIAAANEWLYLLSITDSSLGMAMVASGAIGRGIAWLEALVRRGEREYEGAVGVDVGRISLAEVYVALLAGRRRPSLRVLAGTLFALVRARLIAARRAEALLLKALRNPMLSEVGVFRARIHLALGLLQKAKGRSAMAREHLERAHVAAAAQDAGAMLAKIEAALASL
jgi:tetratricopeptide (TPR) repeat protein